MDPFLKFFQDGTVLEGFKPHVFRHQAARLTVIDGKLYRRGFSTLLLRCLSKEESAQILEEVHAGACGNHEGARAIVHKLITYGYFWPTMRKDTTSFVQKCNRCQQFADVRHDPPSQ